MLGNRYSYIFNKYNDVMIRDCHIVLETCPLKERIVRSTEGLTLELD